MCPVLTGRSRGPAALGVIRGRKPVSGAFPGRLGGSVRITTLYNTPLPADLPRPWRQKKEAPLPARIQTIIACQTGQDLNRMLEKPVQIWAGCPRTPLQPTTVERHAQKYPWIRVMHRGYPTGFLAEPVGHRTVLHAQAFPKATDGDASFSRPGCEGGFAGGRSTAAEGNTHLSRPHAGP
jgi:hypothetical protein